MKMNVRHELFAAAVASGLTYANAARRAGYSQKSAANFGSQLAAKPEMAKRIADLREQPTPPNSNSAPDSGICRVLDKQGRTVGVFLPLRLTDF